MTEGVGPGGPAGASLRRDELQRRAVRGAAWTVIATAVSLPLAFLVNLLVARVLGVVDFGQLAFLTALIETVGGVVALGVNTGLIQFGAKAHAAGRRDEVRSLLSATQGFRLLVVAPVLALVVIFVAHLSPWLLALTVVFGVLLPSAFSGATACFGIENRTAEGAKNALLVAVVTQAAVVITVLQTPRADAIWGARLVCGGLAVTLALAWISRDYRKAVVRPSWPGRLPRAFWQFAVPAGAAEVVGGLVMSRSEIFVLKGYGEAAAVGLFAVAFGVAGHLFGPALAFLGPLIPAVAGLREVDTDALRPALLRALRASSTMVGCVVAAVVPFFALALGQLYGKGFEGAGTIVVVLSISQAVVVGVTPITAFIVSRLAGRTLLRFSAAALALDVGLAVALVPLLGVWGAVIANVAASLTYFGLQLVSERRDMGLPWAEVRRATLPLVLGCLCGSGVWAVARATSGPGVWPAAVGAVGGLGAYGLLLALTRSGLTTADRAAVVDILPPRLRNVATHLLAPLTRAGSAPTDRNRDGDDDG